MRIWVIIGLILLVVLPVISQETTPPVDLPTETMTLAPTATETPTETPTSTATATIALTFTPTAELTPEVTATFTETATPSPTTQPPELTETLIVETTATLDTIILPTSTETAFAEITPETTPEATADIEITAETTVESTEPVTMTATPRYVPLRILVGQVLYQNRASHGDIQVAVTTLDGVWTSNTISNEAGFFTIPVPSEESYRIYFSADLHRAIWFDLTPTMTLPVLTLVGGDLNGDGCINGDDLNRLLATFEQPNTPQTDITSDGITDAVDLAILTGNYMGDCVFTIVPMPEITPEVTETP